MARDDVEWEYAAYAVPPELEKSWLRELTARRLAQLDNPGNWWILDFLCNHNLTGYLREVIHAAPLGTVSQRCSYLELLLTYADRCRPFYPVDDIRAAIQCALSGADDLTSNPDAVDKNDRIRRLAERAHRMMQSVRKAPWGYDIDLTSEVFAYRFDEVGVNAGTVTGVDDVWHELNLGFARNFPMDGAPAVLPHCGDELPLTLRMGSDVSLHFPVEVVRVAKTDDALDIELRKLAGNFDGPGGTIHFHFYEHDSQVHMRTRGSITPGSSLREPKMAHLLHHGYSGLTYGTWQPFINSVTANVARAKGYFVAGPGT